MRRHPFCTQKQRGQILPLVGLMLVVLMGFAGLAVDLGYVQFQQRQQQSAADAAAVAGAQALIYKDSCSDSTDATTAADNDSSANGYTNGSGGVTVTVTLAPSLPAPFGSVTCGVEASISAPHPAWFSSLFGFTGNVGTEAVALVENSSDNCLTQLDTSGTPTFNGNLKVDAPGCSWQLNGSPTFNGGCGKATLDYIGYANGSVSNCSLARKTLPAADPCLTIPGCNYLTNNPPSTSPCTTVASGGGGAITAGCYNLTNGISPSSLGAGLYVFTGAGAINLGGLTASNITIYATGSTYLTLGGSGATLSACTTSCTNNAVANVLYFQTPSDSAATDTHGSGNNLTGLIYAPSSDMTISGNSGSGYSVFIIGDITINGGGNGMTFASPPPDESFAENAQLAY
jgi:hypothetical protein